MGENRQTADNFGYETKRLQILWSHILQEIFTVHARTDAIGITDHMGIETLGDLSLNTVKGTSTYKQNVFGVNGYHALLGMLASTLRGYIDDGTFK